MTVSTNDLITGNVATRQDSFIASSGSQSPLEVSSALASSYQDNYLQTATYPYNAAATGNFNLVTDKSLYGAGPSKTTIRINDACGVNGYIARIANVQNVVIEDVTFDLNATGNPLQTFIGGFDSFGSSGEGSVNVTFRNCTFKDGKGRPFLYINGQRWLFENCTFQDHDDNMIIIATTLTTTQVIFRRCFFTNYSKATSNCCVRLSPRCHSTIFDTCYFLNTVSDQFAIEFPTGSSVGQYISGLVVRNCRFDGNNFGGGGVSGPMEGGLITGNFFLRGQNSHRTGIECVGRNNIIVHNYLQDGAILMAEVNPTVEPDNYSKSQIVAHNIFVWTRNTGTQMRMLDICGQEGSIVQGNIFDARAVPNVPNNPPNLNAMDFGVNTNKFCGRMIVRDNIMMGPTAAAPFAAIRMNFGLSGSTLSSGIKVLNNTVTGGWQYFLQLESTGDTDFEFSENDGRGCTTGLYAGSGVPGARHRRVGNIRPNGTKELSDVVTVAAAGTYTPNAFSLNNISLQFSAGNITIAAPLDPQRGQKLTFHLRQDATGGRTITWNAVFSKAADGAGTANQNAITEYVYDGTVWRQVGGALAWY